MHSKKFISIPVVALALLAVTGAQADVTSAAAAGPKKVLKRLAPKPVPVVVVGYDLATEPALSRHILLEGSLLSIGTFVSNAEQQSVK